MKRVRIIRDITVEHDQDSCSPMISIGLCNKNITGVHGVLYAVWNSIITMSSISSINTITWNIQNKLRRRYEL